MKLSKCFFSVLAVVLQFELCAQIIDTEDDEVAGIPVNYTESKTGSYDLPDPLTLQNGDPVQDEATWFDERRPEILQILLENQFGRPPEPPSELRFEITDAGTPAFDGLATRKQVTIFFTEDEEHYLDLLLYLPASSDTPSPILLQLGWGPNNLQTDDPGVKVGRSWNREQGRRVSADTGRRFGRGLVVLPLIERGYATAVFNYSDIEPDSLDGFEHGIRKALLADDESKPAPDGWGSIAAWAWGASRVVDYFETDNAIDSSRIAITGASRLGKTALWAGATDERIACVIAQVSGEGGAAFSRRDYGETVAHLVAPTRFPYWFAENYHPWADRMGEAPFDSHLILSLIAPRPLLLQTGNTDKWSDPYGEFLAAKAATPVYELLGAEGIEPYSLPPAEEPLMTDLGYFMHDGGHGVTESDWEVLLDFLDAHFSAR